MQHAKQVTFLLVSALLMMATISAEHGTTQGNPDPNTAPNPYRVDEDWAKLPADRKWGAAIGIDIARDGTSIWVFDRCATADDCSGSNLARSKSSTPRGSSCKASVPECSTTRTGFGGLLDSTETPPDIKESCRKHWNHY